MCSEGWLLLQHSPHRRPGGVADVCKGFACSLALASLLPCFYTRSMYSLLSICHHLFLSFGLLLYRFAWYCRLSCCTFFFFTVLPSCSLHWAYVFVSPLECADVAWLYGNNFPDDKAATNPGLRTSFFAYSSTILFSERVAPRSLEHQHPSTLVARPLELRVHIFILVRGRQPRAAALPYTYATKCT